MSGTGCPICPGAAGMSLAFIATSGNGLSCAALERPKPHDVRYICKGGPLYNGGRMGAH